MAETAEALLRRAGVEPTGRRLAVIGVMLAAGRALAPREILVGLGDLDATMNKVTLYRVLDLFVERGLAERHSSGDRSFRYCVAARPGHHHFYCLRCGAMRCLDPALVRLRVEGLDDVAIERFEVRLDGVCPACRKQEAAALEEEAAPSGPRPPRA